MDIIDYIITFESTHYAIMVEKRLKETYKVNMIPTPREITASCGLSIKFTISDFSEIKAILDEYDKDMFNLYSICMDGNNKIYNRVN